MDRVTRYLVVTPVRDEAPYIEKTIRGVCRQTVQPLEWVIVDDGSTDDTGAIIDRFAAECSWVTSLHRKDRGSRDADTGAVDTFLEGFRTARSKDWEFIVNLDGDVALEPDYFESCFNQFRDDPELGVGGGTLFHYSAAGATIIEPSPVKHVRGATKIYRKACWDAIGGLSPVPGWDFLDEIKANMQGWRTRSFAHVTALHLRPTGAAGGNWSDAVKNGRSDYFLGYHPLFMLVKCAKRIAQKPYVVNGLGHFVGFLGGYLSNCPQLNDRAVISYLRGQQMRRLLLLDNMWK